MTYTHIFVPTEGAPFITKEDPKTVVGGYIEVYNQVPNVQDCFINGVFLKEGNGHPEDIKAWNAVSNLLKNHKKKITIYVNEEGLIKCCPNIGVIGINQSLLMPGARPLMGNICIALKTSRCRDIIEELDLKTFNNYKDYCDYIIDRDRYNVCWECDCEINCDKDAFFILTKEGEDDRYLCQDAFEDNEMREKYQEDGWECDDWE